MPCLSQAVREGSWWARAETDSQLCELEGVASLQQLAAVMGDEQPEDAGAQPESPAAGQQHEAQEVCVSSEGSPAPSSPPLDGFSSREQQQQYLDLEREVQEMQRMLEEATAAAERGQQSHSDQQYLSEILGEWGNLHAVGVRHNSAPVGSLCNMRPNIWRGRRLTVSGSRQKRCWLCCFC